MGGLLQGLVDQGLAIGMKNQKILTEFIEVYKGRHIEERAEKVQYVKLDKCFDGGRRNIVLCVERLGAARGALFEGLVQLGGQRKLGRTPKPWSARWRSTCAACSELRRARACGGGRPRPARWVGEGRLAVD